MPTLFYMLKNQFCRNEDSKMLRYHFRKEKIQWYFREIDYENMYAKNIENEVIMNLKFKGFMRYL